MKCEHGYREFCIATHLTFDFTVGSADILVASAPNEAALTDMRLALDRTLRERRDEVGITHSALAQMIESSRSRVGKMDAGDASVPLDLLIQAMRAIGA